jgi:hypothetical protein
MLSGLLCSTSFAAPQIGGGTCSTAMVSGTYFYLLDGAIVASHSIAYAELGKIVADGQGNLYGSSFASGGGQQARSTLSGTYSVRPNCTGTITQAGGTVTFQVINNGQGMVFAVSVSNALTTGVAYRQTAGASSIQCGAGSLSGGYGYLLTGVAPGGIPYSDVGQLVVDGNGNGSVTASPTLAATHLKPRALALTQLAAIAWERPRSATKMARSIISSPL